MTCLLGAVPAGFAAAEQRLPYEPSAGALPALGFLRGKARRHVQAAAGGQAVTLRQPEEERS